MPCEAGLCGEQAEDAHAQPSPCPLLQQPRRIEVDAVHLVQVVLDERPLLQQQAPCQVRAALRALPEPVRVLVPLVEPRCGVDVAAADEALRAARFGAI